MRPQDLARERTCFEVLRSLAGRTFVLVGGFAISAYGFRRFSVDLDLVLPASEVDEVRTVLRPRGFVRDADRDGTGILRGRFERWIRRDGVLPVSVDMMVDGIADRVSGVVRSFQELRDRATIRRVAGIDSESWADAPVPDRETLLALKIQTGRPVDLRDVAVLAKGALDMEALWGLLSPCPPELLRDHLTRLRAALGTREFQDSVKGVFVLTEPTYREIVRTAEAFVAHLLAGLR